MKNHWLNRKKEREALAFPPYGGVPQTITVHQGEPQHLDISPMTIQVDWATLPSSISMFQTITTDGVQWTGPGLPPSVDPPANLTVNWGVPPIISCVVTVGCPTLDGIPKEINVSSSNQGIC